MLLDVTCKAGKLQVSEDGFVRVKPIFGNNVTWQVPCQAITKFTAQQSTLGAVTLLIHAFGVSAYQIETFAEKNIAKLQSLFPHIVIDRKPKPQHWYQDVTKRAHVETYQKDKIMQKEVEVAAQYGWMPQTSAGVAGHINVGRTVTAAALTGGASLLLGASRSKDKLTITYVRTPEWLTQNQ